MNNHSDEEIVYCKRKILEILALKTEKQMSTLSSFVTCLLLGSKKQFHWDLELNTELYTAFYLCK